jgi:hypothetical protein
VTRRTEASTPLAIAQRELLRVMPYADLEELRGCYRELLQDCEEALAARRVERPARACACGSGSCTCPGV